MSSRARPSGTGSRASHRANSSVVSTKGFDPARCRNCDGEQWVCENHQDLPWEGSGHAENCGAGAPCPVCNRDMACAPYRPHWARIESLELTEDTVALVVLSSTAANQTYGEGGARTVHMATFEDGGWSDSYSAYRLENRCWRVTHWMPVPDAPAIATTSPKGDA